MSRSRTVMRPQQLPRYRLGFALRLLRAFGTDRQGATAVIFALGAIALVGTVGAGIDYGRLNVLRAKPNRQPTRVSSRAAIRSSSASKTPSR